jgi:hypothetical protein
LFVQNGTEDIMERIESMQDLLEKAEEGAATMDKNNIMRLVQGTVMPQVNAGVTEVAKVFLRRAPDDPATAADKNGAVITARQQAKLQVRAPSRTVIDRRLRSEISPLLFCCVMFAVCTDDLD